MGKSKKSRAVRSKSVFWQRLWDILLVVGIPVGIPAIRMFIKGNQLRPRKWFWMLIGAVGFAVFVAGVILAIMGEYYVLWAAWLGMIPIAIYSIYIDREYVLKFNVMVDAGYFEDQQRMLEANRIRQDQTWIHEAQDGMEKIMGTENRVKSSREITAEEYRRQVENPAPAVNKVCDDNTHVVEDSEAIFAEETKQKRKLDL